MSDAYRPLYARFGAVLQRNEPLARYTVARLGGPADVLLTVSEIADLVDAITLAHQHGIPWRVLGGGANVLAADAGFRGLVIVNHAKLERYETDQVIAASGMHLSTLARHCMSRGLSGLEWAVSVPGTLGGAVINNAGAHGGDMSGSLRWIELLCLNDQPHMVVWSVSQMDYAYRHSALKGTHGRYVVLMATLKVTPGHDPAELNATADGFVAHRKQTQPPGASLGSIFKNPPGDHAGRLIEAAGLKGFAIGGVQISSVHANFFINNRQGTASDYRALIDHARETVLKRFGVTLELEIEYLGDW
ncbi:MAG: UDP-N-acetylmuramate dehydrogenase [Anaerolineae bacterium]|nr:UDP-N-acetylmuramate dehydrogenase [Anaerolineae bacterium]